MNFMSSLVPLKNYVLYPWQDTEKYFLLLASKESHPLPFKRFPLTIFGYKKNPHKQPALIKPDSEQKKKNTLTVSR